ncbi:hypothetical protein MRB53_029128 [Persea americana]|uniref:Uncharacterized protein n=1 Tax=Persea americana TaxID=3435 RepID=A0ACC2KHH5_PERAE|nr:hypothetical protein MRB53_029128 [Persea americana]
MAGLTLHGDVFSTATMRALVCLKEKELDFEFVPINMGAGEHKKEPFILLNPFGQVPALEAGDLSLFESRAITKCISHRHASKGTELIYRESKKMATVAVWMEVEAHQFDPEASNLVWELVFKPMLGMTTDPGVVGASTEKLGRVLDVYETRLGHSKYLAGESFTLADLHHLPCIHYLMTAQVKDLFVSRTRVSAWCQDIMARPAWAKVLEMQKK